MKINTDKTQNKSHNHRLLSIQVFPGANKTRFLTSKFEENIKISVSASAENGKANKELVRFLEKEFECEVKILRGMKSSKKILKLTYET